MSTLALQFGQYFGSSEGGCRAGPSMSCMQDIRGLESALGRRTYGWRACRARMTRTQVDLYCLRQGRRLRLRGMAGAARQGGTSGLTGPSLRHPRRVRQRATHDIAISQRSYWVMMIRYAITAWTVRPSGTVHWGWVGQVWA